MFASGVAAHPSRARFFSLRGVTRYVGLVCAALTLAGLPRISHAQVFAGEIVDNSLRFGPTGLALDTVGGVTYLYVVDNVHGRILKYNLTTGAQVASWGNVGTADGEFNGPYGIAVDPISHDLYIAERGNHRIQRIRSTDGSFVLKWGNTFGNAQGQFNAPVGVAADASGNVYVADHSNNRIQKFNVQGTTVNFVTMWGTKGAAAGQFDGPYGVSVDGSGNVWVADAFNGRVQRFNANGGYIQTIGAGVLNTPVSVSLDASGNVYVCDTNGDPQDGRRADIQNQRIVKFTGNGVYLSQWGSVGEAGGQFKLPFSLVIDLNGTGYVADYYNTRLQKFNLNATLPNSAPQINSVLTANGTANAPFLYNTFALAMPAATTFAATGLPAGLTINASSGAITGTPSSSGAFNATVTASNSVGNGSATVAFNIAGAPGSPEITSGTNIGATVGTAFSYSITATNSPTSYAATGLAAGLTINAATGVISGTPTTAGTYTITVSATNAIGTNTKNVSLTVSASSGPNGSQAIPQGGSATFTAAVAAGATVQWQHNGSNIAGATGASHTVANATTSSAGIYTALVTNGSTTTGQSFILGISLAAGAKVAGSGREVGSDIVHQNGNIFDQILLEGPSATFSADAGQITRCSYVDFNNDIVQVEFSGAGTVTIVLDQYSPPAPPAYYNQAVNYVKGHATIVVAGANENSYLSVFSVGRATAVNQTLFRDDVAYEGMASIANVAVLTTNGRFGAMRTANSHYLSSKGLTGLYAPGVTFDSVVYLGEITADSSATPVLLLGSAADVSIRGGDLGQLNNRAVQVSGFTRLPFMANSNSHGASQPAQACAGRLEENGVDVTTRAVNPN